MKKFRPWLTAALVWTVSATGVTAYSGTWHVVENLGSKACYRVHDMIPRDGWKDVGEFNTFRMAGGWIWSHRDICASSPVYERFRG